MARPQRQYSARHAPESRLHEALIRHEFVPYYHPQYDVLSGAPLGAEVLVRWYHPERGTVPPSEFLPMAEHSGEVLELGDWVAAAACREMEPWREAWPGFRVYHNCSPRQLATPGFARRMLSLLERGGVDISSVDFEIANQTAHGLDATGRANLERVRARGAAVVIDDVGTDELAPPPGLAVDGLKLSPTLMSRLLHDPAAEATARQAVAMAAKMARGVAANGIEDPHQREILIMLGVTRMQGFLFCRPGPAEGLGCIQIRPLLTHPRLASLHRK
ncbi:MAG: EAL domain-containing protein [Deltaproteobacteria bacterium]|nr:EAL domain-containing protein [Deltaproteobacteria bacterium]